jgi:hypothetical protein
LKVEVDSCLFSRQLVFMLIELSRKFGIHSQVPFENYLNIVYVKFTFS